MPGWDEWPYGTGPDRPKLIGENEAAPMMFYDGNGGWRPWMPALMVIAMPLFWGLVIWGAVPLPRVGFG